MASNARAVNDALKAKAFIVEVHAPALYQALLTSIGGWLKEVPSECPADKDVFDFMMEVEAIEAENLTIATRQAAWVAKRGATLDQKVAQLQRSATSAASRNDAVTGTDTCVLSRQHDDAQTAEGVTGSWSKSDSLPEHAPSSGVSVLLGPVTTSPPAHSCSPTPAPVTPISLDLPDAAVSPFTPSPPPSGPSSPWHASLQHSIPDLIGAATASRWKTNPSTLSVREWLQTQRQYLRLATIAKGAGASLVPGDYAAQKVAELFGQYPSWTACQADEAERIAFGAD
ncbi:hypothetical protein CYLTODRAFT_459183 [Cylindrobasidium torrendii FP15055 ss-10]|uniref:Uncharacterized protein n=1 Tax=Cylindrobasidium torrendii FP15055 ss-10 TaxID=1314674 RepID=A0A0D7AV24_9AGAR|nr:hypothetical protein CYLTODRAFT_459183 [Cylindrobasidium torrendii FP15055 ss-10]